MEWNEFSELSKSEWLHHAKEALKDGQSPESFVYKPEGLGGCSPFTTSDEAIWYPTLEGPVTLPGVCINSTNVAQSNEVALKVLSQGASSLWFQIQDDWDPVQLLKGIYLDMVTLIFTSAGQTDSFFSRLELLPPAVKSSFGKQIYLVGTGSQATHLPVLLEAAMDFRERSETLAKECRTILHSHPGKGCFISIELKPDFLAQIAEIRQIHRFFKQPDFAGLPFFIACTSVIPREDWSQIHPIIPITYQLLSAHLGMSHAAFGPDTSHEEELVRQSLFCQHVFQEESRIGKVADPMAGAYMTDQIEAMMAEVSFSYLENQKGH